MVKVGSCEQVLSEANEVVERVDRGVPQRDRRVFGEVVGVDGDLSDVDPEVSRLGQDLEAEEMIVGVGVQGQRFDELPRVHTEARVIFRERQSEDAA